MCFNKTQSQLKLCALIKHAASFSVCSCSQLSKREKDKKPSCSGKTHRADLVKWEQKSRVGGGAKHTGDAGGRSLWARAPPPGAVIHFLCDSSGLLPAGRRNTNSRRRRLEPSCSSLQSMICSALITKTDKQLRTPPLENAAIGRERARDKRSAIKPHRYRCKACWVTTYWSLS